MKHSKLCTRILSVLVPLLLNGVPCPAQDVVPAECNDIIQASQLFSEEKYDECKNLCTLLMAQDSTSSALYYMRGCCSLYTDAYQEGEADLLKAIELDPDICYYYEPLFNFYLHSSYNDSTTQVKLCEFTILMEERFPGRYDSYAVNYVLQLAYRRRSNMASSLRYAIKVAADPSVQEDVKAGYIENLLGEISGNDFLLYGPQYDKMVDTALYVSPTDSSILKIASRLRYSERRIDESIELLERWSAAYPESKTPHIMLMQIAFHYNDEKEIMKRANNFQKSFSDKKSQAQALSYLGDFYSRTPQIDKSIAYYEKLLKLDPDYSSALNNLAYFYSVKGIHLKKAEKMARKALAQNPNSISTLDTLAWILYLRGKYDQAEAFSKRSIIMGGKENKVVLEHYATILEKQGNTSLATYYRTLAKTRK